MFLNSLVVLSENEGIRETSSKEDYSDKQLTSILNQLREIFLCHPLLGRYLGGFS
jgi:hypothetical protein